MKKGFYIFIVLIFLQIENVRGQNGDPLGFGSGLYDVPKIATIGIGIYNLPFQIKHTVRLINGTKSKYPIWSYLTGGYSMFLGTVFLSNKSNDIKKLGGINIGIGLTTITLALLDKYSRPHLYGWNVYIVPPLGNGTGLGLGFVKRL